MKTIIAVALAWAGVAAAPIGAGSAGSIAEDETGSNAITNFTSLDRKHDDAAMVHQGIRLAAAVRAGSSTSSPSSKPAIYGHNVDDVVIGNTRAKNPTDKGTDSKGQAKAKAIYNGTVTSEPTNTLTQKPRTGDKKPARSVSGVAPGAVRPK
jgi:hypothetical protein